MNKPHKYEIKYHEYDRHDNVGIVVFRKTGNTLVEAVNKLPKNVLDDVFMECETDERPKTEADMLFYLNNIDTGGFSCLTIKMFKNGQVFTYVDFGDEDEYEDEQDW